MESRGLLIQDAFATFDSSRSGQLSLGDLYGGMQWLGIDKVHFVALERRARCRF